MGLKQKCPYCFEKTIAMRLQAFYVGSSERIKLWECRKCFGIWSNKREEA